MRNTKIEYKVNAPLKVMDIIRVLKSSGIGRPVQDEKRITKMFANANLVVTAWDEENMVGISRSLTDFSYCCYLSDLAVAAEYQGRGIGKQLIAITKKEIGEESMLLLLAVPSAMEYYPKMNFETVQNGFIIKRKG